MGRKRTIDRDATMNAIESVVRRQGLGGLSIDAVAKEAGISKSSVVYDFQNKAGLLAAFTRSRLDNHRQQIEACVPQDCGRNSWLRALLEFSTESPSDEDTAVAMLVSVAMSAEEECHNIMREEITASMKRIDAEAEDPRKSRLAFAALHGLKSLEYFGFYTFDAQSRSDLLSDITELLGIDLPLSPCCDAHSPSGEDAQADVGQENLDPDQPTHSDPSKADPGPDVLPNP